MKILILSDIHSNYDALQSVVKTAVADEIWCLGDLVDYGPQPAEVVEWARREALYCVRGNHDHALAFDADCRCGKRFRELSVLSRQMNRPRLSPGQIEYLGRLPSVEDVTRDGVRFRLAHAAPGGDLYRYLMPTLSDDELAKELDGIDADFIFCGHTHLSMIRKIGGKVLVNPGSVGQSRDGWIGASYALWTDGRVELCHASYNVEQTARKLQASPLPAEAGRQLAQVLRTGGLAD